VDVLIQPTKRIAPAARQHRELRRCFINGIRFKIV
jgi:hypothetical protein